MAFVKTPVEERVPNLYQTKEVIGAYVTAVTRIHLYGFLSRLRENEIYCDTDSVIIIQPSAEPWPIATVDKLGDMQSELKTYEHIVKFVSGAKTYAYRVIANEGEKIVCKVRSITLNYHASQLVYFEVIRAMILEHGEPVVNVHT